MNQPERSIFTTIIKISRPWYLLAGVLFFGLGTSIVKYLGKPIAWDTVIIGLVCTLLLQLAAYTLKEYFDFPEAVEQARLKKSNDDPLTQLDPIISRSILLLISVTILTSGAMLTFALSKSGALNPAGLLILGIGFVMALSYGVPPLRLAIRGYGDLVITLLVAVIIPALAMHLQIHDLHALLVYFSIPLVMLFLAMELAMTLPTYASDQKYERLTLMTMLSWQHGMNLHNLLLLFAYLVIGLETLLRLLPWSLAWPGLLTLPFAVFQIWQMLQIGNGAKPHWRLLTTLAAAILAATAYFITFTLWTR